MPSIVSYGSFDGLLQVSSRMPQLPEEEGDTNDEQSLGAMGREDLMEELFPDSVDVHYRQPAVSRPQQAFRSQVRRTRNRMRRAWVSNRHVHASATLHVHSKRAKPMHDMLAFRHGVISIQGSVQRSPSGQVCMFALPHSLLEDESLPFVPLRTLKSR